MNRKRKRLASEDDSNDENGGVERIGNHIYFYCEVNNSTVLDLVKYLREINQEGMASNPPPPVFLHINSQGGDYFSGLAGGAHISKSRCPVISIVEGQAASAATIMSVKAQQRIITPYSYMLIHEISSGFWGKVSDMKQEFANCVKLEKGIVNIYNEYTALTESQIKRILKTDTYWDANECLKNGLVDKIGSPWTNSHIRKDDD